MRKCLGNAIAKSYENVDKKPQEMPLFSLTKNVTSYLDKYEVREHRNEKTGFSALS